jgi:hypothetical protein
VLLALLAQQYSHLSLAWLNPYAAVQRKSAELGKAKKMQAKVLTLACI